MFKKGEAMNNLHLSLTRIDDGSGKLFASLKYKDFQGSSSCFVDLRALEKAAQRFTLYPIPNDGSVCIEGGYFADDMKSFEQTHLHISGHPKDALGHLILRLVLAVPFDEGVSDFRATLTCELPIAYEQLKHFSQGLMALIEGHANDYRLAL